MVTVVVAIAAAGLGIGIASLLFGLKPDVERSKKTGDRRWFATSGISRPDAGVGVTNSREEWSEDDGLIARICRSSLKARIVIGCLSGLLIVVVTRWPALFFLGPAVALALPHLEDRMSPKRRMLRVEALATWTEMLRDTLNASAGLAQAITSTSDIVPSAIRGPVTRLSRHLQAGTPMEEALRGFAADLDDPVSDLVVCALILAASARVQKLAELLSAVAASIRAEAALTLRIESSRASARSGVRTIIVFSAAFMGLLVLLARPYLAPFGSVTGQLVLFVVGALYLGGMLLMSRMVRPRRPLRLLDVAEGL